MLHCPTTTGGNPQMLAQAERELGLDSTAVAYGRSYMDYATDKVLYENEDSQLKKDLLHWKLLWRAWRKFDIVHYNFGQTILPAYYPAVKFIGTKAPRAFYELYDRYRLFQDMRDVEWLKRAGKGICVTFQGDDARQGDFCLENFEITTATEVGYYTPEFDKNNRQKIARFAARADRIYALNPDLLHVLPSQARFMPYGNLDLREWQPRAPTEPSDRRRLTVLHAPTHRGAKGTSYIIEAVERLKSEGDYNFDFLLVENIPHADVRRLYEGADLLIDQLLAGWYGGLGVEHMALAHPVICYVREEDLKFIPEGMRREMPVINATPHSIYEVLKSFLTERRAELDETGRRSRAFVERWHDPLQIAAELKKDYEEILTRKRAARTNGASG